MNDSGVIYTGRGIGTGTTRSQGYVRVYAYSFGIIAVLGEEEDDPTAFNLVETEARAFAADLIAACDALKASKQP